jgi:RNA polymerase sigma-70 factor, ECF subfamily
MSLATNSQRIEELYQQATIDFVCRALLRLGSPRNEVSDLAQDVLLIALRKRDQFDASRSLQPWLWGIARKRLADFQQLARLRHEVPEQRVEVPALGQTNDALLAQSLHRGLGELDEDVQLAVVLHDMEGWTLPECAKQLNITVDVLKYRITVGRAHLRTCVTPKGPIHER